MNDLVVISDDEVTILSTGLAVLYRGSPKRGTTAMVTCSDGRTRRLTMEDAIELVDKVCQLAGKAAGVNRKVGVEAAQKFKEAA